MTQNSPSDDAQTDSVAGLAANEHLKELLAELEEDQEGPVQKTEFTRVIRRITSQSSGPIPHPDYLERYNELIDDGANRFMSIVEREQMHRHAMDRRDQAIVALSVGYDHELSKRGQQLGFVIAVLFLIAATALGIAGHEVLAGVLGGSTVVGLASVFVAGRLKEKDESAETEE